MDFDIRTIDSAYIFVKKILGMTGDTFVTEYYIKCEKDFELFWDRNAAQIETVDISDMRIMAFHILGSLDECREIKEHGLKNLQEVLSTDTFLKMQLGKAGVIFDIPNKKVSCDGISYDIDYEKYRGNWFLPEVEDKLRRIAHRVYYDYCVNGFLLNDNVFDYGTDIHERPEFLMTLGELFPQVQQLEDFWKKKAKSYRVDFFATIDQVHRFNFQLDDLADPPYEGWCSLSDEMKMKKWMLSHAIDRARNDLDETYLYIKDDEIIPSNQIVSISEIHRPNY